MDYRPNTDDFKSCIFTGSVFMGLTNTIKDLADSKHITIAELERNVGISNGQIRKWNQRSPKVENSEKVADYFNVSTDYLLGRSSTTVNINGTNSGMAGSNNGTLTINHQDKEDFVDDIRSLGAVHLAMLEEIREIKDILNSKHSL